MKTTEKTILKIEEFEGAVLSAYRDAGGVWTIGYGHTGTDVYEGMSITREQAHDLLLEDIETAEDAVETWDGAYNWTQNEFDALVSFAFNLGAGCVNTLTGYGRRTKAEIAKMIPAYCHVGAEVLEGLLTRRKWEQNLFLSMPEKEFITMQTISRGDSSDLVKILQIILGITADGIFGDDTKTCVMKFQESYGLVVDGIVGKMTWNALFSCIQLSDLHFIIRKGCE